MVESDDVLLERGARLRDRDAMDALIRRYANLVHGVALRQTRDAELSSDIAQAVFIVFVRRIGSIRSARALPAWFHQTTRLAVKNADRSAIRRRAHEHRAAKPEQTMIDSCLDRAEELSQLDDALAALGSTDRDVVLMKYFQGHDTSAIAGILGITEPAARKRLSRAIERIRHYLTGRSAALSVAGVTGLLTMAGSHSAPAAVVQASVVAATASAATTGVGAAIANNLAAALLWSKLKLAACALVLTLGSVGAVSMHQLSRAADAPQPAPAPAKSPLQALEAHYALADGQVLRLIEPPFPAARTAWLAKEFPGIREVGGLGFTYAPGALTWRHMSMSGLTLDRIAKSPFQLEWYRVMGLDLVPWDPIPADVVVRNGASTHEKLDALADLIGQRTGQPVKFTQRKMPRPSLILRGKTQLGLKGRDGRHIVLLSQQPLDEQTRRLLTNEERPQGYHVSSSMDGASERVAAPFFPEPTTGIERNTRFLVAPDGKLDPADPELVPKLKRIAENLRAQVGGEWSVEPRELEVWALEKVQL